jgi:ubiquinone/menaquinone biosynthesis C-methylase UbiE
VLLNPLRKLVEDPHKLLGSFVQEGMLVLEPGCGMGFFTLPLARMVGPGGRVVVVEIQPKMLAVLARRARKAHLLDRIELREAKTEGLGVEDLTGQMDFATAIHMVHEIPEQKVFFAEIRAALKPGGKLLVVEPRGHVSRKEFDETMSVAQWAGFELEPEFSKRGGRVALLTKSSL